MLLVQDPKLLLLDEPVAGMTRHEREKTGELLHTLAGQHTIIVTEHDMDFVRHFARQVTVLHMGKVLTEGTHRRGAERSHAWSRSTSAAPTEGTDGS